MGRHPLSLASFSLLVCTEKHQFYQPYFSITDTMLSQRVLSPFAFLAPFPLIPQDCVFFYRLSYHFYYA